MEVFGIACLNDQINSFAICDKARLRLACSNIKKKHTHITCEATIWGVLDLPVPISWTFMYNDGSAGSSLFVCIHKALNFGHAEIGIL